jgi:hypothetical protein
MHARIWREIQKERHNWEDLDVDVTILIWFLENRMGWYGQD